jgi:alpha-tubulin suppressor-like RCC1 family protein
MRPGYLAACLLILGACTKTETVEVEKIVEKPAAEVPGSNSTVGGQPATVIATGSDVKVDTPTSSRTNEPGIPEPKEAQPLPVADHSEPVVKAVNPAKDSQGATLSTEISATFSEALKAETITVSSFTLQGGGGAVSGKVRYDAGSMTAILTPDAPLRDGESYTATLTQEITDVAGNKMLEVFSWPFKVQHLKTIAMAAGTNHTLALKENGSVWGWGRNHFGQLGDGSTLDRKGPVRVEGLSDVVAIATGGVTPVSLAVKKDGTVWAWGANTKGQVGDGSTTHRLTPVQVTGLSDVIAVAANNSSAYALKKDGTVWAWGNNSVGQLGDGTFVDRSTPVQVVGVTKAKTIAAGGASAIAMAEDPSDPTQNTVWAWGFNYLGQLCNGQTLSSSTGQNTAVRMLDPAASTPLTGVKAIASGNSFNMVLMGNGDLYGCGANSMKQLWPSANSKENRLIKLMSDVTLMASGPFSMHLFALTSDGRLWGWGNNDRAQLMTYSETATQEKPLVIGTVKDVVGAATGFSHTVLLKKDGTVISAGDNLYGELGTGTASFYAYYPNLMPTAPAASQVSGRAILTKDGEVWVWGRNVDCEMGLTGQPGEVMVPVRMNIPDKITQLSNSDAHFLALSDKKEVWAWGNNSRGQLGDGAGGTGQKSCVPQKVKSADGSGVLGNIENIAAGNYYDVSAAVADRINIGHSIAVQKNSDGTTVIWAWGNNASGALGIGSTDKNVHGLPVQVTGIPADIQVRSVSANAHTLVITTAGKFWAWGQGTSYQLCNATRANQTQPVEVTLAAIKKAVAGNLFSLLLLEDGSVKSCGNNFFGQLGNGTTSVTTAGATTVQDVKGLSGVLDIAAGGYNSAAITADHQLWAWGNNVSGQLGQGHSITLKEPERVRLKDGSLFDKVAAVGIVKDGTSDFSGAFTAVRDDGTVWDWGFLNIRPTYLIHDGEAAFSATPLTVNWP